VIWFIVSLFLLPCTSGPYITILWYLASESSSISTRWMIYLIVYNIIFILPMVIITLLVWLWVKSAEELATFRHKNIKLIHLIVWLLMLGLWVYVLLTM
jgi:cytochrome c biogenesis protein CcdA